MQFLFLLLLMDAYIYLLPSIGDSMSRLRVNAGKKLV